MLQGREVVCIVAHQAIGGSGDFLVERGTEPLHLHLEPRERLAEVAQLHLHDPKDVSGIHRGRVALGRCGQPFGQLRYLGPDDGSPISKLQNHIVVFPSFLAWSRPSPAASTARARGRSPPAARPPSPPRTPTGSPARRAPRSSAPAPPSSARPPLPQDRFRHSSSFRNLVWLPWHGYSFAKEHFRSLSTLSWTIVVYRKLFVFRSLH